MARPFDYSLDALYDFNAFLFGQSSQLAKLDELAELFVGDKIVIETYRRPEFGKLVATREFRKAVATSALTARAVYFTEKGRGRGVAAFKENIEALRKVREIILHLAPVAIVPGHEGNVLQYRREIDATKRHLDNAVAAADSISKLRIYNYKNTNIFKRTFVQNLGVCWKKLTGKRPLSATMAHSLNLFGRAAWLSELPRTLTWAATPRTFLAAKKFYNRTSKTR